MARAAGVDTSGMTAGEIQAIAEWAARTGRAPTLPPADIP